MYNALRDQGQGCPAALWGLPSHTCAMPRGWHRWKFLVGGSPLCSASWKLLLGKFSLQAHISSLLSAKQKLKSQVQSWDFKVCQSCSALWHAAMYPWCQGPKWDTLAYFQGRKHRGILHLASQRCSTYVIPKECPPGLPDNSKRHQPCSLKLNLWKQLKHF